MNNKPKLYALLIVFVGFAIAAFNSVAKTSLLIADTDPTSYIIVVMLMLFALLLFTIKEDILPQYKLRSIIIGTGVFGLYAVTLIFTRGALSYLFWSYRIDALLFPLILLSFIIVLFGVENISKFRHVLVFAIFASPSILMPLLAQGSSFAALNASLVFNIVKSLGIHVVQHGYYVIAPSGSTIQINTTCAPLGTFIALVLFIAPVAYFYNGRLRNKALWLISGAALILSLNVMRMIIIALTWAFYGIGYAAGIFHLFAGQILFYLTIIVMVLVTYKYGMHLPDFKHKPGYNKAKKAKSPKADYRLISQSAVIILFALAAFIITLPFSRINTTSAINFAHYNGTLANNSTILNKIIIQKFTDTNTSAIYLGPVSKADLFLLLPKSNNQSPEYALVNISQNAESAKLFVAYNSVSAHGAYIMPNGVTVDHAVAISQNHSFNVNYFSVPYAYKANSYSLNFVIFAPTNQTNPQLCAIRPQQIGSINYVESKIYSSITGAVADTANVFCPSYILAST